MKKPSKDRRHEYEKSGRLLIAGARVAPVFSRDLPRFYRVFLCRSEFCSPRLTLTLRQLLGLPDFTGFRFVFKAPVPLEKTALLRLLRYIHFYWTSEITRFLSSFTGFCLRG